MSLKKMRHEVLRFTPTALAKLRFISGIAKVEIGGFLISTVGDPLLVEDVRLVPQIASARGTEFQDAGLTDVAAKLKAAEESEHALCRMLFRIRQEDDTLPTPADEEQFEQLLGECDWAVLLIHTCSGDTSASLRFQVGPGAENELSVGVECEQPFLGTDYAGWQAEFDAHVTIKSSSRRRESARLEV